VAGGYRAPVARLVDLHCHILPGLDDGARSLADSVGMARQAHADGIEVVCATPHIRHDHRVEVDEIASRVAIVQREFDRLALPVRVMPAGELAATATATLDDEQLRRVTLGGKGRWVLLEPAPGALDDRLLAVIDDLHARGVSAVVAHPERHAGADFVPRLTVLAQRGCLLQWTAELVAGARPADLVLDLARAGLVHVLGSDAHSSVAGRPVALAAAYAVLGTVCTPAQLHWIRDTAPWALLRGQPLSPSEARA
jgi:protein-tyrosine phosphatase